MTDSSKNPFKVQSTAGKSFRKPVETFVVPGELPKTDTMLLAKVCKNLHYRFFAKIDEENRVYGCNEYMVRVRYNEMKDIIAR